MVPQSAPIIQLSPTFRGPSLVLCWFSCCQAGVGRLALAQISCFSGYPSLPFSSPPFLPFFFPPTHAPIFFLRRYCLLLLLREIYVCFYWGSPCYLASLELLTTGFLSFALLLVFTYEWVYTMFMFLSLHYLTQDSFFLVPSICMQISRFH